MFLCSRRADANVNSRFSDQESMHGLVLAAVDIRHLLWALAVVLIPAAACCGVKTCVLICRCRERAKLPLV